MNRTQRFLTWLFGPEVERESREWTVECSTCHQVESVWERGGIRYKASGAKRVAGRCHACGRISMLKVSRSR